MVKKLAHLRDSITILVLGIFLFGCYATTHRGPWALAPGEMSGSGSYMQFKDDDGDEPLKVLGFEGRLGLPGKLDIGYMRTSDISSSGGGIDTHWMDAKIQLINRQNIQAKPTLSLGYGFGKKINEDDLFVNTLYLSAGVDEGKTRIFYTFRSQIWDDEIQIMPKWLWEMDFSDQLKSHVLGIEVKTSPTLQPVVEIGKYYGDDFGDGMFVFSAGVNIYFNPPTVSNQSPDE